jgi:adenosylcobyric acid synthase
MSAIMVQGTSSSVGKSLLVTALCRIWARRGLRVAPFKAQNMSLNAGVTPDGGEIGRAQLAQARAARVRPSVDMNPILLKPESVAGSQLVVLGRVIGSMGVGDYRRQKGELREIVAASFDRLRASHDLVVLEGSGSPAEINLREGDLVNMWMAARARASVILVADIERGGALAAIVGTLELLEPDERARVQALVINKFRGDRALFADGVRFLEERTGVPVAGVVPHLGDTRIPGEDSLELDRPRAAGPRNIAIIKLPHVASFDEFDALDGVRWVDEPSQLGDAALVIVPGTKCTVQDLAWLRQRGLADALVARAAAGGAIHGICGGYQMLGERIVDPYGVESLEREVAGLALLPVVTRFGYEKVTEEVRVRLQDGREIAGYEIHCGRVERRFARPFAVVVRRGGEIVEEPEGAVAGNVSGTQVHGLYVDEDRDGHDRYDALADHFEAALDMRLLDRLAGL